MRSIFTNKQIEFMKRNYTVMTYKEIADFLGFAERQIRGKLNNMGLTKLRKINDHYFDNIDDPLKAYFIGFIYADGWIVFNQKNRNYELGMELQSEDCCILEKLNEVLGNANIIQHKQPTVREICGVTANIGPMDRIRIYSKNIVLALMENGIVQNKTNKDVFPIVSQEYFFDFLRGYIDGDGCFYFNKNNKLNVNITCSSYSPLSYIQNKLSEYNIISYVYKEKDRKYRFMCSEKTVYYIL